MHGKEALSPYMTKNVFILSLFDCLAGHRLLGWKVFLKLLDLFLHNHLYHSMLLEKSLILSNSHWLSVLSSLEALRRASFILGIWKFYSDVYEGWSCFHLSSWLIMFVCQLSSSSHIPLAPLPCFPAPQKSKLHKEQELDFIHCYMQYLTHSRVSAICWRN